jgi:hypothetical protein
MWYLNLKPGKLCTDTAFYYPVRYDAIIGRIFVNNWDHKNLYPKIISKEIKL